MKVDLSTLLVVIINVDSSSLLATRFMSTLTSISNYCLLFLPLHFPPLPHLSTQETIMPFRLIQHQLDFMFDMETYSQLLLHPFGHSTLI